jgi:hypothetical protein
MTKERRPLGEKMLVCTKCNIEYEDGKELCSNCGNPLVPKEKSISNDKEEEKPNEAKPDGKLICPNCKLLYEKMTTCIRCGATLVKDIPSEQGEELEPSVPSEVEKEEPHEISRPEGQDLSSTQDFGEFSRDDQVEGFSLPAGREGGDQKQQFPPLPSDVELSSPDRVKKERLGGTYSPEVEKEHPQVQTHEKRLSDNLPEDRRKRPSPVAKRKENLLRLSSQGVKILILIGVAIYLLWSLYSYLTTKRPQPSAPPSKEAISPTLPRTPPPTSHTSRTSNMTDQKENQNKRSTQSSSVPREVTEKVNDTIPSSSIPITSKDPTPGRQERESIRGLLEKIRQANLRKDIDLFMSCYSADFRDREGKKRLTLKSWRNFNYIDLSYNVKRQSISGNTANARVEWLMSISQKNSGQAHTIKTVLDVSLRWEDGIWKIIETETVS